MYYVLAILVRALDIALSAMWLLMTIRAILSWLPGIDNAFTNFVFTVTEFVIAPVRALLEKFDVMQGLPIDISFMITYMLILFIQMLLPTF